MKPRLSLRAARPALLAMLVLALLAVPAAARPPRPGAQTFQGDQGAIAFSSNRDGNFEIWRMDIDGHGATQLTSSTSATATQPAWSASGAQIAFTSDHEGDEQIYRMTATGAGLKRLSVAPGGGEQPAWFPGDDRIVFVSDRSGNDDLWYQDVDANGNPVGNPVQLTTNPADDDNPAVSPDGTTIAFASARVTPKNPQGDVEIFVMQANAPEGPNNKPQQLTQNDDDDRSPDWSPNGRKIAFASDRDNPGVAFRICTMTKQGAKEQPLSPAGQNAISPTWSPDGQRLAYAGGGGPVEVFRINADGSQQTNLTEGSAGSNAEPAWQPR